MRSCFFALASFALFLAPVDSFSSCISLSWTATGDDGYSGRALEYDVRYSSEYITEANWSSATRARCPFSPKQAGERETLMIGQLEGEQTYYFALKVADERYNWSTMSNVVARVTGPDRCTGSVGNADCSDNNVVTLGDVSALVGYLFLDGYLCCFNEADTDHNGYVTISDISRLIDYLFLTQSPLPDCK